MNCCSLLFRMHKWVAWIGIPMLLFVAGIIDGRPSNQDLEKNTDGTKVLPISELSTDDKLSFAFEATSTIGLGFEGSGDRCQSQIGIAVARLGHRGQGPARVPPWPGTDRSHFNLRQSFFGNRHCKSPVDSFHRRSSKSGAQGIGAIPMRSLPLETVPTPSG